MRVTGEVKSFKNKDIVIKLNPFKEQEKLEFAKVRYEIQAHVEHEVQFEGAVIPIPKVLLFFLTKYELMTFSVIMEEIMQKEICNLYVKEIAFRLAVSAIKVSQAMVFLRRSGIIEELPNGKGGHGRIRRINFNAIQRLNDLTEGQSIEFYTRLRKRARKTKLTSINKEDFIKVYNHKILPPDHDPEEEEEYD